MRELSMEQVEYAVGRLARLVELRGITQRQLEQLSGVTQSTISKILGGDGYTPSHDVLRKLFQALGLKLNDILNESDSLPNEILGYLATPLTGLSPDSDKELRRVVNAIRDIAADDQFSAPRFEIYWPGDHTHPREHSDISARQVYITDRSRASTHDFIVLFCGAPSYGVGQENELATQAGVPAIRLLPRHGISRMMTGSFLYAHDIEYSGTLESRVDFSAKELKDSLQEIRKIYFRHSALYRGLNGDAFGMRLEKLVADRCGGDYVQFATDLGISLHYLHNLMKEPFAVSNPSARLLRRMAARLGERVAFLVGESDESDPIWIESNASWRSWIDKTNGIDARIALELRDQWCLDYLSASRMQKNTSASFRTRIKCMRESDWDKLYQQTTSGRPSADSNQQSLL